MEKTLSSLLARYVAELSRYVAVPEEAGLLEAYEIGRDAAVTGKGILQLSEAYHRGLRRIVSEQHSAGLTRLEGELRVSRSADFFAESLASFEMVYQGYRNHIAVLEEQERRLTAAREEADRANQAKSKFLSSMSHELRTPLTAILGFGQLLELDELSTDQRSAVTHIRNAGAHLLDLINELLEISRIESGHLDLKMEQVAVAEVVLETLDLTRNLAETRGIAIHVEPTALFVWADRRRLKQVLLNLVANAIKYNRENGTIDIGCQRQREQLVRIGVTDTGYGVPEDALDRLFKPFDRLGADQSNIEGTGLGLALVKRFIEAMGGSAGVCSIEGEGTTFWIELVETPQVGRPEEITPLANPAAI